ncbi:hypothetical protein JR316_0006192 [Psilocybe cubensis]|uniref:Uncharacterized protein n=1 Tax=Psilocybe cubensis TaxID=181762 RepID=A0ACB8H1Q6_PSICU|nr:hypothetical protein JR316_0006192 [Psilocybe cubensis]KAH9481665.1 hypothetical protein JR316_0006192 [Psilocybe cubensis]
MANVAQVTRDFISGLTSLSWDSPGQRAINALLAPALDAELALRTLFVVQPDHPVLRDPYVGLIDAFATPISARRTWPRSTGSISLGSMVVGHQTITPEGRTRTSFFPRHYMFPLPFHLRRRKGVSCIVNDLDTFKANFILFTGHAFMKMRHWNNVVVAGGSILACLGAQPDDMDNVALNTLFNSNAYKSSDVDVFLYGLTPLAVSISLRNVECSKFTTTSGLPFLIDRSAYERLTPSRSIATAWPHRPVQIILRLYASPAEILAGFDIDSSCMLYNGDRVWLNCRALASLIRQCNTVDLSRRSPSYEIRLVKYSERGMEIYIPFLRRDLIDPSFVYNKSLDRIPLGLPCLVVLEKRRDDPDYYHKIFVRKNWASKNYLRKEPHLWPEDYDPVDRLLASNYDFSWVKIPFGKNWNADRDMKMNNNCPKPETEDEEQLIESEKFVFIRGHVSFITNNPGQQLLTGSFRPETTADWTHGLYFTEDEDRNEMDATRDDEVYHRSLQQIWENSRTFEEHEDDFRPLTVKDIDELGYFDEPKPDSWLRAWEVQAVKVESDDEAEAELGAEEVEEGTHGEARVEIVLEDSEDEVECP